MRFKQLIAREKYNKMVLLGSVTALSIIILFVSIWVGWIYIQPIDPDPVEYNTYECATNSEATEVFRLHALDKKVGRDLVNVLCNNAQIRQGFGAVIAQWKHKNIEDTSLLHDKFYDLVVLPSYEVELSSIGRVAGYEKIASYASYDGYFVARAGLTKPVLDINYWNKKKLGLLRNPRSRSGHVAPLVMLREHGVGNEIFSIERFESHLGLREALQQGHVDIIGSYWGNEDIEKYGDLPRTKTYQQTPSSWYLLENDRVIQCAVWYSLKDVSLNSSSKYFSELKSDIDCEEVSH